MNVLVRNESASRLKRCELTSVGEIEPFYDEWRELWERSGRTTFQSPMWLIPWMENFTGDNLRILLWRDLAGLRAVAAFYEFDGRIFLAGNGISDYLDVCVDPAFAPEVAPDLREWLAGARCELNQVGGDSLLTRLGIQLEPGDACAVLSLIGRSLEDFAPARQLEKLRYYRRRAGKLGEWKICAAQPEAVQPVMQELFRLHTLRWSARNGDGVLHGQTLQNFHAEAAENLAAAGNLRLYTLDLEGKTVGVLYGFADARATYYYLSGFDPEFDKISPGTLLIGHAIESAISEGHAEFNFLRGLEPYKYSWGAIDQPTFRVIN